jgi:hypothetical protein
MRIAVETENLKGRDQLGNQGVGGRILNGSIECKDVVLIELSQGRDMRQAVSRGDDLLGP